MSRTFGLFLPQVGAPGNPALTAVARRLGGTALGLLLGVVVLGVALRLAWAAPSEAEPAAERPVAAEAPAAPRVSAVVAESPSAAAPATTAAPVTQPAPTAAPAEPRASHQAEAFRFGGRPYTGVLADAGRTFLAPQAGTIQVRVYQFIDNDVRVGTNVTTLPFFPYVTLTTATERIVYRPGALGSAVELAVRDGQRVAAGDPLFVLVTGGASSWRTFYDRTSPYNVVVTRQTNSGVDLDTSAVITLR